MVVALNINVYWRELRKLAALNSQFFFHWTSDSEARLNQEWLFSLTYAWFGFIQMWVWFENYRLACIYREKLLALFQSIWEANVIVQAKAHWNAQQGLSRVAALSHSSHVRLFVTLLTAAHQAPWPMNFSRQEYWSGLPSPPPGESSWHRDRTHVSYVYLHWQAVFFH